MKVSDVLTSVTFLGTQSIRLSSLSLMHSSVCSDTGTENCIRPGPLESESSVQEVPTGLQGVPTGLQGVPTGLQGLPTGLPGSSLTGMGVAKGAGIHWALDRSPRKKDLCQCLYMHCYPVTLRNFY